MPTLRVKPIDLSAPGSYRKRRAFLSLLKKLRASQDKEDAGAVLDALDEADTLILGQLETDDNSPVEPLLDDLSAEQFDEMLTAIAFRSGLGEASKPSSTAGPEVTDTSIPTG